MLIRAEQPLEYGIVEMIHESAFGGRGFFSRPRGKERQKIFEMNDLFELCLQ